ncbi:MAG: phage terminase small subunit P27 family [Gordonia polyisoprenivorans]|nr:phage terminase small subunit P27 family [Gordonia polyisoprenivorans]
MAEVVPEPPRPLDRESREVWERVVTKLYAQGRVGAVDLEMVCRYCETDVLYREVLADVRRNGVLIPGRNSGESVRNPALIAVRQLLDSLNAMAKAIPLTPPDVAEATPDVDGLLSSLGLGDG